MSCRQSVHRFNVGPVIFETDGFVVVTVHACTPNCENTAQSRCCSDDLTIDVNVD